MGNEKQLIWDSRGHNASAFSVVRAKMLKGSKHSNKFQNKSKTYCNCSKILIFLDLGKFRREVGWTRELPGCHPRVEKNCFFGTVLAFCDVRAKMLKGSKKSKKIQKKSKKGCKGPKIQFFLIWGSSDGR